MADLNYHHEHTHQQSVGSQFSTAGSEKILNYHQEVRPWEKVRNKIATMADWRFTTEGAHIKIKEPDSTF